MVHVGLERARDDFDKERSKKTIVLFGKKNSSAKRQGLVVRRVDNAIHRINLYTVNSIVRFNSYLLDSDLSIE